LFGVLPEVCSVRGVRRLGEAVHLHSDPETLVRGVVVERCDAVGKLQEERDPNPGVHVGTGQIVRDGVQIRTDLAEAGWRGCLQVT
jgi:hypothetical protein